MVDANKTTAEGDTKKSDKTGDDDTKKGGSKRKGGIDGDKNDSGKRRSGSVKNKDQAPESVLPKEQELIPEY